MSIQSINRVAEYKVPSIVVNTGAFSSTSLGQPTPVSRGPLANSLCGNNIVGIKLVISVCTLQTESYDQCNANSPSRRAIRRRMESILIKIKRSPDC